MHIAKFLFLSPLVFFSLSVMAEIESSYSASMVCVLNKAEKGSNFTIFMKNFDPGKRDEALKKDIEEGKDSVFDLVQINLPSRKPSIRHAQVTFKGKQTPCKTPMMAYEVKIFFGGSTGSIEVDDCGQGPNGRFAKYNEDGGSVELDCKNL